MVLIKTFVEGFDELIGGGFLPGTVNLICGTTGSMKSALTYSILYKNVDSGMRALYLTLEQSERGMIQQMRNFGWDPDKLRGSLRILDRYKIQEQLEAIYRKTFLEILIEHLLLIKSEFNFNLLAIDCLSALQTLSLLRSPRQELFKFFEWLRKLDTTSFLVSEMSPDSAKYGRYDEAFLSDGIIHLTMEPVSDTRVQRRITCVKIRNSAHSTDWYALLFDDGKFHATKAIQDLMGE